MVNEKTAAEDLARLRKTRGTYKGQVTMIENWIKEPGDHDEFDVESKMETLETYYRMFNVVQAQVEELDDGEQKERDSMETRVFQLRAKLKRMRFKMSQKTQPYVFASSDNPSNLIDPSISNLRVEVQAPTEVPLPKLPTFDGEDYLGYPNFIASFEALVDQSRATGFTKLKKFVVLRGALKGRALQAVEHLILTEDNYDVALKILKDRFLKPRLIFQSLKKKLLDLPKLNENYPLRQMLDSVNATM